MLITPWWLIPALLDAIGIYIAWHVLRFDSPDSLGAAIAFICLIAAITLPIWALCYATYEHSVYALFL